MIEEGSINHLLGLDTSKLSNLIKENAEDRLNFEESDTLETHIVTDLQRGLQKFYQNLTVNPPGVVLFFTGKHAIGKTESLRHLEYEFKEFKASTVVPVYLGSQDFNDKPTLLRMVDSLVDCVNRRAPTNIKTVIEEIDGIKEELRSFTPKLYELKEKIVEEELDEERKKLLNRLVEVLDAGGSDDHILRNMKSIEDEILTNFIKKVKEESIGLVSEIMDKIIKITKDNNWKIVILADEFTAKEEYMEFLRDVLLRYGINFLAFMNVKYWKNVTGHASDAEDRSGDYLLEQLMKRMKSGDYSDKGKMILSIGDEKIDVTNRIHISNLDKYLNVKITDIFRIASEKARIHAKSQIDFSTFPLDLIDSWNVEDIQLGTKVSIMRSAIDHTVAYCDSTANNVDLNVRWGANLFNITATSFLKHLNPVIKSLNLSNEASDVLKAMIFKSIAIDEISENLKDELIQKEALVDGRLVSRLVDVFKGVKTGSEDDKRDDEIRVLPIWRKATEIANNPKRREFANRLVQNGLKIAIEEVARNSRNIRKHTSFSMKSLFSYTKAKVLSRIQPDKKSNSIFEIQSGLLQEYRYKFDINPIFEGDSIIEKMNAGITTLIRDPINFKLMLVEDKKVDIPSLLRNENLEKLQVDNILGSEKSYENMFLFIRLEDYAMNFKFVDLIFISLLRSDFSKKDLWNDLLEFHPSNHEIRQHLRNLVIGICDEIERAHLNMYADWKLPHIDSVKLMTGLVDLFELNGFILEEELIKKTIKDKIKGKERKANALQMLDNLVDKGLFLKIRYNGLSFVGINSEPLGIKDFKRIPGKNDKERVKHFLPIPELIVKNIFNDELFPFYRHNAEQIKDHLNKAEKELNLMKERISFLEKFGILESNPIIKDTVQELYDNNKNQLNRLNINELKRFYRVEAQNTLRKQVKNSEILVEALKLIINGNSRDKIVIEGGKRNFDTDNLSTKMILLLSTFISGNKQKTEFYELKSVYDLAAGWISNNRSIIDNNNKQFEKHEKRIKNTENTIKNFLAEENDGAKSV